MKSAIVTTPAGDLETPLLAVIVPTGTTVPASLAALPRLEKLDLRWVTTLVLPAWVADLEAGGCAVYR